LANGASSANAPNSLVKRDGQGMFAAGSVTGAFVGDGSSLTNLNPASLTGTVASAAGFTGSLAGDVTGTQGATVVGAVGGQTAANVASGAVLANGASSANAPNTLVKRDGQGKFVAGSVTGAFVGDGSSLTNLSAANLTGALPSAMFQASAPSGLAMISMLAQDPALVAGGYQRVMSITSPVWVNGSTAGSPSARSGQAAVWDGQELIVWGGNTSASGWTPVSFGGMYRPDLDQWQGITPVSAPAPRAAHTAVWTGSAMIVWGGQGTNGYLNDGGRFQPSNQLWSATTTSSAPSGRTAHVALWTGSRMLVWGGQNSGGLLGDGASYDPIADQWTTLILPGAPVARSGAGAVLAANRLLLWGGVNEQGGLNTGAQLLLDVNGLPVSWTAMNTAGAPLGRSQHSVVWTGQKMIIWGGSAGGAPLGDGAAYDPVADAWATLSQTNAPTARASHGAVWTGQEMLVFGGETVSGSAADGAAYNPATDSWRPLSTGGAPLARSGASAVWSGAEFIVFAGLSGGQPVAALQRLNPQPPWYLYRKP
jgi:N-acetylneuraminic acid mutarotase